MFINNLTPTDGQQVAFYVHEPVSSKYKVKLQDYILFKNKNLVGI